MKPSDAREIYYFNSGKASDIVRQLGLAAIAIAWVFKTDQAGQPSIPQMLFAAAAWAIVTLSLDALQYLYAAAAWGVFHRHKEKKKEEEYTAPRAINWPTLVFFWGKSVTIVVAYGYVFRYLLSRVATAG